MIKVKEFREMDKVDDKINKFLESLPYEAELLDIKYQVDLGIHHALVLYDDGTIDEENEELDDCWVVHEVIETTRESNNQTESGDKQ